MRAYPLAWLALGLLFALLGCDARDEAAAHSACGEQGCSANCEALRGENCDILEEACQKRVFDAVVCVRGTDGVMPDIRTLTPEERRAELLEQSDDDAGVEEQASADAWNAGLRLLGLVGSESSVESASIDEQVENVAGFYDSSIGAITLIDHDRAEDSDQSQATLAHELVHALQDQEMGLFELFDRTGRSRDSSLARSCLVEGEAMLYEDLAISLLRGLPIDPGYWDVQLEWHGKVARGEVANASSPYAALWQLAYPVGARFMTDAWLAGGNHAVQGVYWAVPQSTIYWMHGYDAVVQRDGQLVRPLACNLAAAPAGYELRHEESMGPFALYAFLARALNPEGGVLPIADAWQSALHWRQDSFSVFVDPEGKVAVSWRVALNSEVVADALADDVRGVFDRRAAARGAELEILDAQSQSVLDDWEGTDPEACPERTNSW